MSINSAVELLENISKSKDASEAMDKHYQASEDLAAEIDECCDYAKDVLLGSMKEERLTKFLVMMQKMIVARCAADGDVAVLMADLQGDMETYTQTVFLATLGFLIKEEIL